MANYQLPQVRVFQDIDTQIEASQRQMLPTIIGQRIDLLRFNETDERDLGFIRVYESGEEVTALWPELDPNSEVLTDSVRLFGDGVFIRLTKAAPSVDNVLVQSPLDPSFDYLEYYTELTDNQLNAFVFNAGDAGGIDLGGTDLHRAPEVGDYLTVFQGSTGTSGQIRDWTAQIIDVIEDEKDRDQTSDPEEDTFNDSQNTSMDATISVRDVSVSGVSPGVEYQVTALSELGNNAVTWSINNLDGDTATFSTATKELFTQLAEQELDKACGYGMSDISSNGLAFNVRIHDVTDEDVIVSVTSKVHQEFITVPISTLAHKMNTSGSAVFFSNVIDGKGIVRGESGAIDGEIDITLDDIGGVIVDNMFIISATAKPIDGEVIEGLALSDSTLTVTTAAVHGLSASEYINEFQYVDADGDVVVLNNVVIATADATTFTIVTTDATALQAGDAAAAAVGAAYTINARHSDDSDAGGATIARVADASLATVTTISAHGLITGDILQFVSFGAETFSGIPVTELTATTFTIETLLTTEINPAVAVSYTTCAGAETDDPTKNDSISLWGSLSRVAQLYSGTNSVPTANGVFNSNLSTIYSIQVERGGATIVGADASTNPTIRFKVSSSNGIDPMTTPTAIIETIASGLSITIPVGTRGTEVTFLSSDFNHDGDDGTTDTQEVLAFYKGDVWTVECEGRSADSVVGVITDLAFPFFKSDSETQELNISFSSNIGEIEIPQNQMTALDNWVIDGTDTGVIVSALIKLSLEDYIDEVDVENAVLYLQYNAVNNTDVGDVIPISMSSDDRLGLDDPENPLGYGVRKALLNSQGVTVLAVPVSEMAAADMDDALNRLSRSNNVYQIAPLTFDEELQNKVVSHVDAMSTEIMDLWRVAYISTDIGDEVPVLDVYGDGDYVTGSFSDSGSDTYNLVTLSDAAIIAGVSFIPSSIKGGDSLRFDYTLEDGEEVYSEFSIISIESATELLVLGENRTTLGDIRISIFTDTSSEDVATFVGARSEGLNDRRVTNVFPSILIDDADRVVPGYFAAAALAGLAGGSEPHQGLTNSKILGFKEASSLTPASRMDVFGLNKLAESGVTILVGENFDIGVRHELTTNMTDRKHRETMITRNLDSISYQYYDGLSPFIGIANVTPEFIEKVRTELMALTNFIVASTRRPLIGSQILSNDITLIEQDAVLSDKINIFMQPILPFPFNYADIHLQI